jgi:hypothetical protein
MNRKFWLAFALFGWALTGFAGDTALDRAGNLYTVFPSTYQGLPCLQLDIRAHDGAVTSVPVWGTTPFAQPSSPQVLYSLPSDRLYLVFRQGAGPGAQIALATYSSRSGLSPSFLLSSGRPDQDAQNPVAAFTAQVIAGDGELKVWRQFLHVLWWEEGPEAGARYANLPVPFDFAGVDALTRLRMNDLLSPETAPGDLSALSPQVRQHPTLFVPDSSRNQVRVFYLNTALLQCEIADLTYSTGTEILEDRAHFPDIGLMATMPMHPDFVTTQGVTTLLGTTGNLALFSAEPEGYYYATYCEGWSQPGTLPLDLPREEVQRILSAAIDPAQ